jgi:hypothetical protein
MIVSPVDDARTSPTNARQTEIDRDGDLLSQIGCQAVYTSNVLVIMKLFRPLLLSLVVPTAYSSTAAASALQAFKSLDYRYFVAGKQNVSTSSSSASHDDWRSMIGFTGFRVSMEPC